VTAIDDLERQLRGAVARRGRRWARLGRAPVLGLAGAVVIAGGALGARELLEVGAPIRDLGDPKPAADRGPGVTEPRSVGLLDIRVPDPTGGPPWAIRVFKTNRGAGCVQVGQVHLGRFGLVRVEDGPGGKRVFRPVRARGGTTSSLCSGAAANGFPVVKGLRKVESVGGSGDPQRCAGRPCPVRDVRVIRYGLLGPAAREARLVDLGGRSLGSMTLSARTGGAYLFVEKVDATPFQEWEDHQQRLQDAFAAALKRAQDRGLGPEAASREARRAARRLLGGSGRRFRGILRPHEAVEATFAGGRTLRVAGPGRTHERLPGLTRRRAPGADVLRVPVRVRMRGAGVTRTVVVSFSAPVAIGRFDAHYQQTLSGPTGRDCDRRLPGGYDATTRNIDAGELVEFRLEPESAMRGEWCPGRYSGRITYKDGATGRGGRTVGSFAFRIP
jgi:hypothetical protein